MAKKKVAASKVSIGQSIRDIPGQQMERVLWAPQEGPQTQALLRQEFELLLGGAKGGGKSACGIGWLVSGNPTVPSSKTTPIDISYVNCPDYRALALRKNLIDLNSWIDEARRVWGPMGAEFKQNPDMFEFPSGAKIILGHLDSADSVYKYFGNVVHRIFLDELTFIPDYKTYNMLKSCVRSTVSGIRPQLLLTANPGGKGHAWVRARFIDPIDESGKRIPPLTPMIERSFNPFLKQWTQTSRIYIPARLADNKILLQNDPTYYDRLNLMDEQERKAYLYGDWSAFEGEVFTSFRAEHKEGEPDNACHVITPRKLEPWWPRWIGGDWGYGHSSAIFWACQDPNGQVIIYRELVAKEVGSVELGMAIAHASLPDIKGLEKKNMVFYLSPDTWAKRDEPNSIAEMVTVGIQRILGASAGYLMEEDRPASPVVGTPSIGVTKAYHARVLGWQYMRELMRWREVPELVSLTSGREKLPKLQIFDTCTRLIRAIPTATYDKDGEDVLKTKSAEDDVLDGARYCLVAHKFMTNREPYHVFHARRMDIAQERHPEGLDGMSEFFVSQKAMEDYNKSSSTTPMRLSRSSSRRFKLFDREKFARDHRVN
jgi:hypothetical protein